VHAEAVVEVDAVVLVFVEVLSVVALLVALLVEAAAVVVLALPPEAEQVNGSGPAMVR
jgi:hypothetical protein